MQIQVVQTMAAAITSNKFVTKKKKKKKGSVQAISNQLCHVLLLLV
jgi:hypothetical protein